MTKQLVVRLFILLFAGYMPLISISATSAEPILIRFTHVVDEGTPKGDGAALFKQKVEQRLPGKVSVKIYPRSQRFTDEQALLGLLFGDVEMAAPAFSKFRKFSQGLQVFDLPFMFESVEQVHRFQISDAGKSLLSSMEGKGIRGLAYWDNGMRVISADRPLHTPSDLKGLTLRIEPSLVFQKQYARLGAIAIPMPFKHLRNALQDGIVNGYENVWSNIRSRGLQHLRRNFTVTEHSYLGYMVVTSTTFWDKLPADVRTELESILREVTAAVNRQAVEKEASDRLAVAQSDRVQILTLTEEKKQAWRASMMPIWEQFESEIGPEIMKAAKASR